MGRIKVRESDASAYFAMNNSGRENGPTQVQEAFPTSFAARLLQAPPSLIGEAAVAGVQRAWRWLGGGRGRHAR